MGFQAGPFCSPGGTAALLTEVSPVSGNEATSLQSTQFLTTTTATAGPDGVIRLACLPAKQSHTLARCNFIGQKKQVSRNFLKYQVSVLNNFLGQQFQRVSNIFHFAIYGVSSPLGNNHQAFPRRNRTDFFYLASVFQNLSSIQ